MSSTRLKFTCFFLLGTAIAGWSANAAAGEGVTSYAPGATTGAPLGALPAPGFSGALTGKYIYGNDAIDNTGASTPIEVKTYSVAATLTWSSPYHFLGARYGAVLEQTWASHGIDTTAVGGKETRRQDFFNTYLAPVVLSWKLGDDVFVSFTQGFYLNDGGYDDHDGVRLQTSYANNYWTFEPSIAVSYLKSGWNLSANLFYDINTKNHSTNYQSGQVFFADLTAARRFGDAEFGIIANITQQLTNDSQNGSIVGDGNKVQHYMVGPLVSYHFERFTLTGRYLANLRTRNDIDFSIAMLTINAHL